MSMAPSCQLAESRLRTMAGLGPDWWGWANEPLRLAGALENGLFSGLSSSIAVKVPNPKGLLLTFPPPEGGVPVPLPDPEPGPCMLFCLNGVGACKGGPSMLGRGWFSFSLNCF
jgi:hypothetical protein